MKRLYPAKWSTSDQYVRTINGSPVSPVLDTLAETIAVRDPFQCPDLHGHTRNFNLAFIGLALRLNGFC